MNSLFSIDMGNANNSNAGKGKGNLNLNDLKGKIDSKEINPEKLKNAEGKSLADSLNLESFFLEGEKKKEGRIGNSKGNYIYSYLKNGIQISEINFPKGKKFRDNRRDELERISNSLFNARIDKDIPRMEEIARKFLKEYFQYYSKNDFQLSSINGGKKLSDSYKSDLLKLLEISSAIHARDSK